MNAAGDDRPERAVAADPLASMRLNATAIADLAFGSMSVEVTSVEGRHLAMLSTESLELDLNDPAQRQFGDYELLELIGEGGMGVVYRAHQASLDRDVAVKLLAAGPWASRSFVERFQREAQNAARMQHPNIVAIYEVGSNEELHFFSMRLIHGGSLADLLKREGKLSALRAAQLLRVVAEAVDYAHRLGVLHLDLKPANALLDEHETPHVADFGLARRLEQGLAAETNEVSGTPSYMAPEQCLAAQKVTPATDIWGLGAILYELVTGQPPYLGATPQETLKRVVDGGLNSPRNLVPQLSRDLSAIIEKCMAYRVEDRYASARELADDLAAFIEGRPVKARALNAAQRIARFAWREPKLAAMAVLAFGALAIGIVATTSQWRRADANATRAEANAAESNERLWHGRRDAATRLMEDGKGFEALGPLLANIEEQERAGKHDPASNERREFGVIQAQGVALIDRMIIPDAPPLAAAFSPDGSVLAIALGDSSVRWYDTATLNERGRVDVSGLPTSSDADERAPRLLRFVDNRRLRVTLDWFDYLASPSNNNTYLVDLDQARVIDFPEQFADPAEAVFSADARHALLRNRRDQVQLWQVEPWQPLSALAPQTHMRTTWASLLGRNARFVADKEDDIHGFLSLRDARDAAISKPVALQGAVTAWAENSDGSQLAIGDSRGRLYVVDTASRAVRQLPTPAGREVTWIAFSEDDAWLAAVRWEGAAFAFDVASGNPLNAGQMRNDFEPHEVAINRRESLLVSTGLGETAVWRLPLPGPNAMEATPLLASPTRAARAGTNSTAICLPARLLATADMDGEVRLWRLPAPTVIGAHAPTRDDTNLAATNLVFDGQHVPDVAYNQIRVAATNGSTATPWFALPQPVGFAELVDSGKTLVATSAHALYVFDVTPAALLERFTSIELPANPLRLATSADGNLAVLSFGVNSSTGFEERLIGYDLRSGAQRAQTHVRGPLRQFELSADGARLLSIGPADDATQVFESAALRRIGVYAHDPDRPVTWAAFAPTADSLWLLARDADDSTANDADLIEWNARGGTVAERRTLSGLFPIAVYSVAGKPFVAARDRDVFDAGGPGEKTYPLPKHSESTAVIARSHDARVLAHALGRDVQLYDTQSQAPIGPPLGSNTHNLTFPFQLAFSADDRQLLAHPWWLWPVAADTRALAELHVQADLLAPTPSAQHVLQVPSPEQRTILRRNDPGPPPAMEARPAPAVARMVRGWAIPRRDPAASPLMLDLTDAYNRPGELTTDMTSSVLPGTQGRVFGLARIDGVDYDMRGGIELRQNGTGAFAKVAGIRVPAVPIAALHVLLFAPLAAPAPEVRGYAYVRLHYRDGSSAVLPIRTQREVPGLTGHDEATPIGWVRGDFLRLIGLSRQELTSNPRLPNPHPEKLIATLDLEAVTSDWSNPVFFAITAEPFDKARDSPVTAGSNPGNNTGIERSRVGRKN